MKRRLPVDRIGELAFNIINTSEEIENYILNHHVKTESKSSYFKDLEKDIILLFLAAPETKLKVVINDQGKAIIIAHNSLSNETIEIEGLGDHFLALVKTVSHAKKKINELKENPDTPLLDSGFIKEVNKRLQYDHREEVGIGEYRYKTRTGDPVEVRLGFVFDDGVVRPSNCNIPEPSENHNIKRQMNKLIRWVNGVAFKEGRDVMLDIAQFHARFMQIHPFRDGNGRTGRLLTNYLLLLNNLPLVNVPPEEKREYIAYLNYALAENELIFRNECKYFKQIHEQILDEQGFRTEENRYSPLKKFFERHLIHQNNNEVINNILDYGSNGKFHANQIANENTQDGM